MQRSRPGPKTCSWAFGTGLLFLGGCGLVLGDALDMQPPAAQNREAVDAGASEDGGAGMRSMDGASGRKMGVPDGSEMSHESSAIAPSQGSPEAGSSLVGGGGAGIKAGIGGAQAGIGGAQAGIGEAQAGIGGRSAAIGGGPGAAGRGQGGQRNEPGGAGRSSQGETGGRSATGSGGTSIAQNAGGAAGGPRRPFGAGGIPAGGHSSGAGGTPNLGGAQHAGAGGGAPSLGGSAPTGGAAGVGGTSSSPPSASGGSSLGDTRPAGTGGSEQERPCVPDSTFSISNPASPVIVQLPTSAVCILVHGARAWACVEAAARTFTLNGAAATCNATSGSPAPDPIQDTYLQAPAMPSDGSFVYPGTVYFY